MRNLIKRIFAGKPKTVTSLCMEHNSTKIPILASQHCETCSIDMCYACSEVHVGKQCHVKLPEFMDQTPPYPPGHLLDVLKSFNRGILMELKTTDLSCICGKKLDHSAAMCAACGLASCSEKCHSDWATAGNCTFHLNFMKVSSGSSIRSILFSNIETLRKAKAPFGTKANKTSSNMICCYLATPNSVLLQRGFRIYGHPNQSILQNLTALPQQLDYYMHMQRKCYCSCKSCLARGLHSVANCSHCCTGQRANILNELSQVEMYELQCECECAHCQSGILSKKHLRLHCSPECQNGAKHV